MERKGGFYRRTLEAVHTNRRPVSSLLHEQTVQRLPLQNRHPTDRPHHTPPINTPSASTALPPASDSHLTSEDPACDTAYMRLSHATTTPGNTPAANFANIKLIMTGDALVDSQPQNEGGGPTGEDSASESTEEYSYSDVESLGLDLS